MYSTAAVASLRTGPARNFQRICQGTPRCLSLSFVVEQIDDDNSGHIDLQELNKALQLVGIRIPGYELRDLVEAADREDDDKIDLEEFKDVRIELYCSFCSSTRLKLRRRTVEFTFPLFSLSHFMFLNTEYRPMQCRIGLSWTFFS